MSAASENMNRTDEVVDRVYMLGGTDDMAAGVRSADPDEVERLFRLNDAVLADEIRQWGALPDPEPVDAVPEDAELDAQAEALLERAADDQEILAAVGGDPFLAARLFRLESARDPNSPELLADLAKIAEIAYEPPTKAGA